MDGLAKVLNAILSPLKHDRRIIVRKLASGLCVTDRLEGRLFMILFWGEK